MCLQFGFVFFWQKDFGAKAAHKMLVKLTPGLYLKVWHKVVPHYLRLLPYYAKLKKLSKYKHSSFSTVVQ
jgi:hypothetical protein